MIRANLLLASGAEDPALPPLVSILIPTFDPGCFLQPALDSVFSQTFSDFELIVVDDGSSDGSVERLRRAAGSRLTLIEQSHRGAPAALNAGLSRARGRYIALLDHDDMWKPEKLHRHVDLHEKCHEIDATFSWSSLIDASGRDLGPPHVLPWAGAISFLEILLNPVFTTTSAWVLRASAVRAVSGFDPELPYYYDLDLILRIALLRPGNVAGLPEVLNHYRIHPRQMSLAWRPWIKDLNLLIEKLRQLCPEIDAAVLKRFECLKTSYFAFLAYRRQEYASSCLLLLKALRTSPLTFLSYPFARRVAQASISGLLLPEALHRALERAVRSPRLQEAERASLTG